jgi:hypothetical protein
LLHHPHDFTRLLDLVVAGTEARQHVAPSSLHARVQAGRASVPCQGTNYGDEGIRINWFLVLHGIAQHCFGRGSFRALLVALCKLAQEGQRKVALPRVGQSSDQVLKVLLLDAGPLGLCGADLRSA